MINGMVAVTDEVTMKEHQDETDLRVGNNVGRVGVRLLSHLVTLGETGEHQHHWFSTVHTP